MYLKKNLLENISLQRNSLKSSYIFLLKLNFKKLIIELYILIIFFILIKFKKKKNILKYYRIIINIQFKPKLTYLIIICNSIV